MIVIWDLHLDSRTFAYPSVAVTTSTVSSLVRVEATLLVGVIAEVPVVSSGSGRHMCFGVFEQDPTH